MYNNKEEEEEKKSKLEENNDQEDDDQDLECVDDGGADDGGEQKVLVGHNYGTRWPQLWPTCVTATGATVEGGETNLQLNIIPSKFGNSKLVYQGYGYTIEAINNDGTIRWRCDRMCSSNKCSGRATSSGYVHPVKVTQPHNHPPCPEKYSGERKKARRKRQRPPNEGLTVETTIAKIISSSDDNGYDYSELCRRMGKETTTPTTTKNLKDYNNLDEVASSSNSLPQIENTSATIEQEQQHQVEPSPPQQKPPAPVPPPPRLKSTSIIQDMTDDELFARRGRLTYELDVIDREIIRRGAFRPL